MNNQAWADIRRRLDQAEKKLAHAVAKPAEAPPGLTREVRDHAQDMATVWRALARAADMLARLMVPGDG